MKTQQAVALAITLGAATLPMGCSNEKAEASDNSRAASAPPPHVEVLPNGTISKAKLISTVEQIRLAVLDLATNNPTLTYSESGRTAAGHLSRNVRGFVEKLDRAGDPETKPVEKLLSRIQTQLEIIDYTKCRPSGVTLPGVDVTVLSTRHSEGDVTAFTNANNKLKQFAGIDLPAVVQKLGVN